MRVLIVLADTDRTDPSLLALELHRGLSSLDLEVRTVALAPGRNGGLDDVVPALAPVTRSIGALLQLRREQRWADVVVCWGVLAASVQRWTMARSKLPTVVVLTADDAPGPHGARSMDRAFRRTAAVVSLTDRAAAQEMTSSEPPRIARVPVTHLTVGSRGWIERFRSVLEPLVALGRS